MLQMNVVISPSLLAALTSKRMAILWMLLFVVSLFFNLHMHIARSSWSVSSEFHTGGHDLTAVVVPRSPSDAESPLSETNVSPASVCASAPQKQISFGKSINKVLMNVGLWKNPLSCDPLTCYVIGFEPNLEHYGHKS
jgi:hypothetical protein